MEMVVFDVDVVPQGQYPLEKYICAALKGIAHCEPLTFKQLVLHDDTGTVEEFYYLINNNNKDLYSRVIRDILHQELLPRAVHDAIISCAGVNDEYHIVLTVLISDGISSLNDCLNLEKTATYHHIYFNNNKNWYCHTDENPNVSYVHAPSLPNVFLREETRNIINEFNDG